MNQIHSLNGLRGIAALLVIWVHFPTVGDSAFVNRFMGIGKSINAGYWGVDIFFVMSGFLITRILINEKFNGRLSFRLFYAKRALRIFPIYYLVLFFCFIFLDKNGFLWCFFYISNYFFAFNPMNSPLVHTWSLSVEEQFYLCWPLILYVFPVSISRRIIVYILPLLALLASIITEYWVDSPSGAADLIYRGVQYRMLSLCGGAAMAFYEEKIRAVPLWLPFGVGSFGCIVIASGFYVKKILVVKGALTVLLLGGSLVSFSVVLLSVASDFHQHWISLRILRSRLLTFFGKISYGLYLYHFVILYAFGVSHLQTSKNVSYGMGLLLLFLCIVVPTISFYFVEIPFLDFKKSIANRSSQRKVGIQDCSF